MTSVFLSSILSKTSQALGHVRRWAISPSSSSDPRSSVFKDLEKLERTLKRIQAALHDAEKREIREEAIKLWLLELKELAYKAEDVLDEYQYEVRRSRVEGRASLKRKRVEGDDEEEVPISNRMGDRIRQIRKRFDEISKDRERLSLKEEDGERRVYKATYPEPTSHMVDESSIYGREHDRHEVIDLLFSEGAENGIFVIPIVGKGGLGKTTIAQLVYSDPMVKQYFHLTGWVCVSDDFDVPRLTKAIIESLTQRSCDLTQLSSLQDRLKEEVKGKRVLLVLDDVWNEQPRRWESLRNPFIGAEIVTIIMTCRNNSVAKIMQTVRPYHPSCLSPEQSWSLFRHYAFGGRDPEEQPRLADMGKQIVKKCSGLPLALKSVGSFLRYTTDEDSWTNVIHSDFWEVDENDEILPALRLSYSRMPAHLKPCFIYCSMFPKDYVFRKNDLVTLWMAQGYIQTSGRGRKTDIGNKYFNDLQRRSFFDFYGYDGAFKMHDMIHDLAKSIAGNECCAIVDKKLPGCPDEVRHLYVKDEEKFVKSLCSYNFSALRTMLLRDCHSEGIVIQNIMKIKHLLLHGCLRSLEFCWKMPDEIPDLFGNLKHLRYLCISSDYIKKLPESICLLYHLQTLRLNCPNLAELPDGLGNLTNLHNLQINNHFMLYLPAGIGKLTNLQIFYGSYKMHGGIGVLKELENLHGSLYISGLRNLVDIQDARDAGLKYKHKLEELKLNYWDDHSYSCYTYTGLHLEASPKENKDVPADEKREEAMLKDLQPPTNLKKLLIEGYGGSKFPEWVGNPLSLASLQKIHIIHCEKIRSLPLYIHDSLGKSDAPIPKSMLVSVEILRCHQLTSIAGLHNLHSLEHLVIGECPQLLILSEEGLPSKLKSLEIYECNQLASLSRMQNLTSLKTLIIQDCPKLQIMAEDQLSSMPEFVEVANCPGLINWCLIQNINCIKVVSGNKVTISNTWEKIVHGFDDLTSIDMLGFYNFWEELFVGSEELIIWSVTHMPQTRWLWPGSDHGRLVIKDCPRIQSLPYHLLPSTLKSLVVESCEDLTCLPLAEVDRCAFEELQLVNCPKLEKVEGLNYLFFPKILRIERCPQLQFPSGSSSQSTVQITAEPSN